MNIHEAIATRRTIKDFKPDPVPTDLLNRALDAGTWAQNHRLTEPWRFTIIGPATRPAVSALLPKTASKPTVVVVSFVLSDGAGQEREDHEATACAVQNVALTAWELGLGMQWNSGPPTMLPQAYALFQIDPAAEQIIGLLYFGFPATIPDPKPRKPISEISRHLP